MLFAGDKILKMNLPNQITLSRIFLALVFMALYYTNIPVLVILSLFVYLVAIFTDMYDGYIARKTGVVTGFGKFFDPLADKILITVVMIALSHKGIIQSWFVSLILIREFLITGLRTLAAYKGIAIQASNWGKIKTVVQMVWISIAIVYDICGIISFSYLHNKIVAIILMVFAYLSLFLTYFSGYDYILKSKKILEGDL